MEFIRSHRISFPPKHFQVRRYGIRILVVRVSQARLNIGNFVGQLTHCGMPSKVSFGVGVSCLTGPTRPHTRCLRGQLSHVSIDRLDQPVEPRD